MLQDRDDSQEIERQSTCPGEQTSGICQDVVSDPFPTVPVYIDTLPDGLIADEI